MALTVAIGSENDDVDAEVYRILLGRLLDQDVTRYATARSFSGWKSVRDLAAPYLADAWRNGVRHALFAIDNDGGAKRAPEHDDTHDVRAQADDKDGCRTCWLAQALPASWVADGGKRCLVVPVQTLDTWLLVLRGDPFDTATPEATMDRSALKKRFFGRTLPPSKDRQRLAIEQVVKPRALDLLRQRPSFRRFESQLTNWV